MSIRMQSLMGITFHSLAVIALEKMSFYFMVREGNLSENSAKIIVYLIWKKNMRESIVAPLIVGSYTEKFK